MLNMLKKAVIYFTVLAMLVLFSACKNNADGNNNTGNSAGDADAGSLSAIEETTELTPVLPDERYDGYEARFLVMGDVYAHYQSREIGAEIENGDIINDAVYRRNMFVEKDLGVMIKSIPSNSIMNDAKKSILAGGHDYDVIMPIIDDGVKALQPGLFLDLNQVSYLNLSNPWWDPRAVKNLTINGKCYFATGDISILDNECTMVIFFNKTIIKDNGLEDPYKLVRDGKWTLDAQSELAKGITRDVDGDGQLTLGEDMFGMQISLNTPHSMFFGAGEHIVSTGADGQMQIVMNSGRAVDIVNKIFEICTDPQALTLKTKGGGEDYTKFIPNFGKGKILFSHLALIDMNFFRNDDVDFGILPYPKYDGQQREYNNFISTICVPMAAIPGNCEDPERIGAILEDMAYHSVNTLTYAYYDQTLNNRLIRDEESSDMLDIIFNTRVYDVGFMFDWGGIGSMIQNMYSKYDSNFASNYEKIADKAQTAMDKASAEIFGLY